MLKQSILFVLLLVSFYALRAQTVEVFPKNPSADDSVTITFHADRGNKALAGYQGDVYIHTGVIIGTIEEPSGWRYVQGDWGKDDKRMKMKKVADNIYEYRLQIRSFYQIPEEEPFLQLAMVFRNENGSLVAKEEGEKDIFYPNLKTYPNGILETVSGADGLDIGDFISYEFINNRILLKGTRRNVELSYYNDQTIRVCYETHRIAPEAFRIAVVAQAGIWKPEIEDKKGQPLSIKWGNHYEIKVSRSPMKLAFMKDENVVCSDELGYFEDKKENIAGLRFWLNENQYVYGTGSRAVPIDRKGQRVYTYNTASFGYTGGETRLNLSIPFLHIHQTHPHSSVECGILIDNPRRGYFDIGKTEKDVLEYGVKDSALTYYLIMADSPAEITQQYTYLTGKQPLPPLWTLGYLQSKFGYKSEKEVYQIVEKTKAAGYPLDGILLDLYWFGDLKDMGTLDWKRDSFPTPKKMIHTLDQQGVKTILITESYFVKTSKYFYEADSRGYFTKLANGKTAIIPDFWAGSAGLLDVFNPKAQVWFWQRYKDLRNTYQFHGWWCDSGEPENHPLRMIHAAGKAEDVHNLYPMYWAKILADNHAKDFAKERLFNMTRSGYAGVQRYSIFPWSGDVSRSWDAYRAQTQIMLGAGLCGIGYMHSDLGGFTGGPLDEELYTRWLQMGTFVPVMRAHGSGLPAEPIHFSEHTQKSVKAAIKLRYRLLPYHYQLAYENTTQGLPLARPLFYHYPVDNKTTNLDNEYLWGENLLIAPVFKKNAQTQEIYLPKGRWANYYTHKIEQGEQTIAYPVELDNIPFFLRQGSFLVETEQNLHNTTEYKADSLVVTHFLYQGKDTTYTQSYFLDDGKNPNSIKENQYATLLFTVKHKDGESVVSCELIGTYPNMLAERTISFQLIGNENIKSIQAKSHFHLTDKHKRNYATASKWNGQKVVFILKQKV